MIKTYHKAKYNIHVTIEPGVGRFTLIVQRAAWGWIIDQGHKRKHVYKNLVAWLRCADGIQRITRSVAAMFLRMARQGSTVCTATQ